VEDPKSGEAVKHTFEYTSEGANVMGVATRANGTYLRRHGLSMRFSATT